MSSNKAINDILHLEEEFACLKREVIEEQRYFLCKYLRIGSHVAYLRSKGLLTKDDDETIQNEFIETKRTSKFLDICMTKGPRAFDTLCDAIIMDGSQSFILDRLYKEIGDRKAKMLGRSKGMMEDCIVKNLPVPHDESSNRLAFKMEDGSTC